MREKRERGGRVREGEERDGGGKRETGESYVMYN